MLVCSCHAMARMCGAACVAVAFTKQAEKYRFEPKDGNLALESIFENNLIICFKYKTITNNI